MEFTRICNNQWTKGKEIYLEAFPRRERKPFFALKHSVKSGKSQLFIAIEENILLGFVAVVPYQNMVMVDYLAVSGEIRSKGTGSRIIQEVLKLFADKKIVLLIERLDNCTENNEQRISRKRFYIKNGFTESDIFIHGASGDMEVLNYGGRISPADYLNLQKYALGKLFFWLSRITLAA